MDLGLANIFKGLGNKYLGFVRQSLAQERSSVIVMQKQP